MKVLIGVDDSAHSKAALEFVQGIPWPAGTRFVVLTAARSGTAGGYTLIDAGALSWMTAAGEATLQRAEQLTTRVGRELRAGGLAAEARAVLGDPRRVLVEVARDWGADLAVVGSHGRSGIDKLLAGSVASHVIAHAPCSVLVVKPRRPSRAYPEVVTEGATA